MEYSNNYKALQVLRKALETMIRLDPKEGYYGCSAIFHAADKLKFYDGQSDTIAYAVNRKAFDEYMLQDHAVYWRNNYDETDEAQLSTAELRQYRIANFYRAIDMQEKVVVAELLEQCLEYYINTKVHERRLAGATEGMIGFCTSLEQIAYWDQRVLAANYWENVRKSSPHPDGFYWFDTVQERIDAVTKLINELKGN